MHPFAFSEKRKQIASKPESSSTSGFGEELMSKNTDQYQIFPTVLSR
jgi:hypothetical protein